MPTTPASPPPSSEGGREQAAADGPRRGLLAPSIRLLLALLGALAGYQLYDRLRTSSYAPSWDQTGKALVLLAALATGFLAGYLAGSVLARAVRRGLDHVDEVLHRATGAEVVVAAGGVVVGLVIASLISLALGDIPVVGVYLTVPVYLLSGYFTGYVAAKKHVEILRLIGVRGAFDVVPGMTPAKVLDTSAVIDGRVLGVLDAGFLEGEVLVPSFVIGELQRLADSADPDKRVRGRRGLDFVRRLQNASGAVRVEVADYPEVEAVDTKLVRLAHERGATLVTVDQGLRKVAEVHGVRVLNLNDLADAVKPAVVPGELIEVKVVREGREPGQGVGYLDDGTMIVVESGAGHVGSRVRAEVTSVLQGPAGKMIFSRLAD